MQYAKKMSLAKKITLMVLGCLMMSVVLESIAQAQRCIPFHRRDRMATRLLQRPPIQQELELSAEQQAELLAIRKQFQADRQRLFQDLSPDERRAKREELRPQVVRLQQQAQTKGEAVLTETQRQRLVQIALQFQGVAALTNEQIARQLKLTPAQQAAVSTARQELNTSRQAVRDKVKEGKRTNQQAQAERQALCRQTEQTLLDIFTPEQRTTFKSMQGPPSAFGQRRRMGKRASRTEDLGE